VTFLIPTQKSGVSPAQGLSAGPSRSSALQSRTERSQDFAHSKELNYVRN